MTIFKKNKILFILVHYSIAISFLLTAILPSPSFAQTFSAPAHLVPLSASFTPVILRGIKVYPDNPLKFDFIVDGGNTGLQGEALKPESEKLIKYFLASLTVPQDDLWVNLSPYEKDRIIPNALSQTDMGKDMLAQDYLLKQITASLIYPEGDTGKKFWEKIYKKAYEQFGTTNIPIDTFNKVWIMPEKAVVYEQEDKAFVVESKLKVMLESDYLAAQNQILNSKEQNNNAGGLSQSSQPRAAAGVPHGGMGDASTDEMAKDRTRSLTSQIVRDVVIPELENEVNNGKNFAQLRQIYNALILAYWFKAKLKTSILNKVYSDQSKVKGIDIAEKDIAQKIYGQYVDSFKQGVMNFIKVEHDQYTNENIPRKYFAGGVIWDVVNCLQYTSTISGPVPNWVSAPLSKAAVNMERFGVSSVSSSSAMLKNTEAEFKIFFEKTLLDYQGRTLCGKDGFFQKLLRDGKYTTNEIARYFGNPELERNLKSWIGNLAVPRKTTLEWILRWMELENSGNLLDRLFSLRKEDSKRPREKVLADEEITPDPQVEIELISEDLVIENTVKPVEISDLSIKEEEISVSPQVEEIQSVPVIPQAKEKKPADPLVKVFMRTLFAFKANRLCGKNQFYHQLLQGGRLLPAQLALELGISENRLMKMIEGSAEFYVVDAVVAKTIERVGLSGEDLKAFLVLRNEDKKRNGSSAIGSPVGSSAILPENLDEVGIPRDFIRTLSAMDKLISLMGRVAANKIKKDKAGNIFVLGSDGNIEPIKKLAEAFPGKQIYVAEENPYYRELLRGLKNIDEKIRNRIHLILRDPSSFDGIIDDGVMEAVVIDGAFNALAGEDEPAEYFNSALAEINRVLVPGGVLVADMSLTDLVDKAVAGLETNGFQKISVEKTKKDLPAVLFAFEKIQTVSSAINSSSSASSAGISSSRKVTIEQKLDHFVHDEKVDAKPYTYKELAEIFKVHRTSMVMRKDSILATFDEANKKRGITKGGFALNLQKHLSYQETETLLKRLLTYFIVQHPEIPAGPVTIADINRITTLSKVTLTVGRSIQARVRKKLDAVNKARGIPSDAKEKFYLSIAAPNISMEAVRDRINQVFKKHLLDGAFPVGPVSILQIALLINVSPATLWDNANHQVSIEKVIDEVNQELAIPPEEEKRYRLHRYNIKSREQVLAGIKTYENYLLRQDVSHKLNDVIPLFIKDIGERTGIVKDYFRQNGPYIQDVRAMLAKVNQSKGFASGKGYILFTDHKNGFSVMSENDFGPLYKEASLRGQAGDDFDIKAILSLLPPEDTQKMDAFAQVFKKVLHDYVVSGNDNAHLLGQGQFLDVVIHAIFRNNEFSYGQRAMGLGVSEERLKRMIEGREDPFLAGLAVKRIVQKLKEYGFSESGRTTRLFLALAENERKLGGISSAVLGSEKSSSSALGSELSSTSEKIVAIAEAILKSPTDGLGKMALAFAKEKEDEKSKYFEGFAIKGCFFGERGFVEYVREKLEETIGIQVADFDLTTVLNLSKEDMYREHLRNGLQQSRRKNILKKYSLKGKEKECFERIATDFFKEKRISLAVNILKAEFFGLLEETVQDKILDSSRPLGDVLLKGYFWGENNLAERMRALVNEKLNPPEMEHADITDQEFATLIGCDRTTVLMMMPKDTNDNRHVSRSDVVRKRVSAHIIDHYLSDPSWSEAKAKKAKDYLFLLSLGGDANISNKVRIMDEFTGIKGIPKQKNKNNVVVLKTGKTKNLSEMKFEELFLQVLFDTEVNNLCGRNGFFFKLFAQGKLTTTQIAERLGDVNLEDELIDWMDGKAQPSEEILASIVNKMDLSESKKVLAWLLFLRDRENEDRQNENRSSSKSSSAIGNEKNNKPEAIPITDPGGTLVTNYATNVRFFMDYDHYYFNVGNIEMFPLERFLTFSEINELVDLGYEKENIRKALADDFRTRKFSYLLKEDFDLGYLEDFTNMIGKKKSALTVYKQIRIYQNGVGKEPKEFQGILETLLQAFKANGLIENDGSWYVEMILVDCDRDLLGNLFHSKGDMQYFLKRLPFHLDVHFIEGDMLDRERMEEIGEKYGKADYIFNRRTIYAQDALKEGKLSLEALKLNAGNLKDSPNIRQRFLFEALKVYLATKNTVSYFSRPGTRYIIEANSSNDVFQLPGGRILHFGNDPAALRKNGTGIYEVLDPSLMAEKGLISFLKYNESQGKVDSQAKASLTWQDFVPGGIKENPPWANNSDYQEFTDFGFGGLSFDPLSVRIRREQIEDQYGLVIKENGVGLVLGLSNPGIGDAELQEIYEQFNLKQIHGVEWVGDRVSGIAENILKKGYSPKQILLHHADMNDLKGEIPSASVDLVYVTNVSLGRASIDKDFAKEIIRVLAPGGIATLVSRLDFEEEKLFEQAGQIFSSEGKSPLIYFRKNAVSSSEQAIIPVSEPFDLKGVGPCELFVIKDYKGKKEIVQQWLSQGKRQLEWEVAPMLDSINFLALRSVSGKILGLASYRKGTFGITSAGEATYQWSDDIYHLSRLETAEGYKAVLDNEGNVIEKGKGVGVVLLAHVIEQMLKDSTIKKGIPRFISTEPIKEAEEGEYYKNLGFEKASGYKQGIWYSTENNSREILSRAKGLVSSSTAGGNPASTASSSLTGVNAIVLKNGTTLLSSAKKETIERLVFQGKQFSVEPGKIDEEYIPDYKYEKTSLKMVKDRLGQEPFDRFYDTALKAQQQDSEKTFIVVDGGCGKGVTLKEMAHELRARGITNVKLFGFSHGYYPEWAEGDYPEITWICDDFTKMKKYFKVATIDFMFSFFGFHYLGLYERNFRDNISFMLDVADLLSEGAEVVYNYGEQFDEAASVNRRHLDDRYLVTAERKWVPDSTMTLDGYWEDGYWEKVISLQESFSAVKNSDEKISSALNEAPGGIDLKKTEAVIETRSASSGQVKGSEFEFSVPPELQGIDLNSIQGFVPVIIDIVPVANIFQAMGLNAEEEQRIRQAMEREPLKEPEQLVHS